MTTQCLDGVVYQLSDSARDNLEDIIYFIGLTTGSTTLAVYGVQPETEATPNSIDVTPAEIGKIIRLAALLELQVVGQLHTHPNGSDHSPGDFEGMNIRYPGYFSIVVPDYGLRLPSLTGMDIVMTTSDGFEEVIEPVKLIDGTGM